MNNFETELGLKVTRLLVDKIEELEDELCYRNKLYAELVIVLEQEREEIKELKDLITPPLP